MGGGGAGKGGGGGGFWGKFVQHVNFQYFYIKPYVVDIHNTWIYRRTDGIKLR